jgi:hypothetical protein
MTFFSSQKISQSFLYKKQISDCFSNFPIFFVKISNAKFFSIFFILYRKEFQELFGVSVSFIATHSGLLRWQNHTNNEEIRPE